MQRGSDAREPDCRALFINSKDDRSLEFNYRLLTRDIVKALKNERVMITQYLFEGERNNFLWGQIIDKCQDYYLTRADNEIILTYGSEIADIIGSDTTVVSLGPGSEKAVRDKELCLMKKLNNVKGFIPVDFTQLNIERGKALALEEFPWLETEGRNCNFLTDALNLPQDRSITFVQFVSLPNVKEDEPRNGEFFPQNTSAFLRKLYLEVSNGSNYIASVDTNLDVSSLKAAYDNKYFQEWLGNFLPDVQKKLKTEMYPEEWRVNLDIIALNSQAKSARMNLISQKNLEIFIPQTRETIKIPEGFKLEMFRSDKYSQELIQKMAMLAGWSPQEVFKDKNERMGLFVFKKLEM